MLIRKNRLSRGTACEWKKGTLWSECSKNGALAQGNRLMRKFEEKKASRRKHNIIKEKKGKGRATRENFQS